MATVVNWTELMHWCSFTKWTWHHQANFSYLMLHRTVNIKNLSFSCYQYFLTTNKPKEIHGTRRGNFKTTSAILLQSWWKTSRQFRSAVCTSSKWPCQLLLLQWWQARQSQNYHCALHTAPFGQIKTMLIVTRSHQLSLTVLQAKAANPDVFRFLWN